MGDEPILPVIQLWHNAKLNNVQYWKWKKIGLNFVTCEHTFKPYLHWTTANIGKNNIAFRSVSAKPICHSHFVSHSLSANEPELQPPEGDANTHIFSEFPKNCRKLRNFWAVGGDPPPWIRQCEISPLWACRPWRVSRRVWGWRSTSWPPARRDAAAGGRPAWCSTTSYGTYAGSGACCSRECRQPPTWFWNSSNKY